MKTTLIAGILVCILLGLVFGSVTAGPSPVYSAPMTVPNGQVGDSFEYTVFVREGSQREWSDAKATHWDVGDVRRSVDKMAEPHDALRVRMAGQDVGGASLDAVLDIDLETREVLRHELVVAAAGSGYDVAQRQALYGPGLIIGYWNETFQPFGFQGKTLVLGDELDLSSLRGYYERRVHATDLDMSWRVTDRATIDGRDAYAATLRVTGTMEYLEHGAPYFATIERIHDEIGNFSAEFTITVTTWISDKVPYPILIETTEAYRPNGSDPVTVEHQHVLSHYEAGTREIPWRAPSGAWYRDWNIYIQRGDQPTMFPTDGVGSTIAYPFSQAVQAVEGDLTLRAFQAWRTAHPRAVPSFGTYHDYPDGDAVSHPQWLLAWSDDKSSFSLVSERRASLPVSVNTELEQQDGSFRIPEAKTFVTFAGAEAAWRSQADDRFAQLPVTYALWFADSISVGIWDQQTVPSSTLNMSWLDVDAESGEYRYFAEHGLAFGAPLLLGGVNAPIAPTHATATAPIGIRPPDIERTTVASLSLLAIFLTVYFFPLLKYAATQGVFLGYAKVRKEALLDNKIRDQIMHLVREDPGINASDIQRKVGAGWGTVVHHLHKLEENRLVSSIVDGRQRCFFPVGIVDFSRRGQMTVLRNERTKGIYSIIADEPGLVQGAIASRVGVSVPSAIWHLRRLEDAGLVGRDKQGRHVHYYPADPEPRPRTYDAKDAVEIV
jgi:predicted transcriptional regulator